MDSTDILFYLYALDESADEIIELNPHAVVVFGHEAPIAIRSSPPTLIGTGRLATFGRTRNNDIILPRQRYYRNDHCWFFLSKSGELILRDASRCLTGVEVVQATPEDQDRYYLHGNNPRQRVIQELVAC